MRKWFSVIAVALAMVVGSFAMAKDKEAGKGGLHGKVTLVGKDGSNSKITTLTVSSHGKKGEAATETIVKADDTTKITKDGAAATLADITVGTGVVVTLGADNKADAIEIHTHKKKDAAAK